MPLLSSWSVSTVRRFAGRALVLAVALSIVACLASPPPVTSPTLQSALERAPLVFVPGITGSKLRDRTTGSIAWGRGINVLRPHDRGYQLALPVVRPEGWRPRLEPFAVLDRLMLFGVRKPVYGPVVDLFLANGYRLGDLADPQPEDTLYLFPYDWRQSNDDTVRALATRLDALRRARGEDRLTIDLLCQSNGAHICRYLIKYGGATFEQAEAGRRAPSTLEVDRLLLVGTANGGSLRILREMSRGRTYIKWIGRDWSPETLFTFPSLYQDLPAYRSDLFVGEDGRALDVDLYDPASWQQYGWSIYGEKTARRLARTPPDWLADPPARVSFLGRMLERARRFHLLMQRDVEGFGETRYHLLQNDRAPTPQRAVLRRTERGWQTLFVGDKALVKRKDLVAHTTTRGDGHAALESQLWLSPQERAALGAEPFFVDAEHFEMILEPVMHQRMLSILEPRPPR